MRRKIIKKEWKKSDPHFAPLDPDISNKSYAIPANPILGKISLRSEVFIFTIVLLKCLGSFF